MFIVQDEDFYGIETISIILCAICQELRRENPDLGTAEFPQAAKTLVNKSAELYRLLQKSRFTSEG